MNPKKNKIFLGRVLFDIGRLLYSDFRSTVVDNKVVDFIKNELNITDSDILEQILYTTHEDLENASIPCDSLAYIRYLSDKLSSDINQLHLKNSTVFQEEIHLQSIFNHLNDNRQDYEYIPQIFKKYKPINFPVPSGKYDISKFNGELQQNLQKILSEISLDTKNINTVLGILEELLTFVPASCNTIPIHDIGKYTIEDTKAVDTHASAPIEIMPFGKYKGTLIKDIPTNYKQWMIRTFEWSAKNERLRQSIIAQM